MATITRSVLKGIVKECLVEILSEGLTGSETLLESRSPTKKQSKEYLANMMQEINNGKNAVLMPVESMLELSKEKLSGSEYNARFNEWMDRKLHHSSGKMAIIDVLFYASEDA